MHHKVSPNEFEKELEANLVIKKRMVISIVTSLLLFVGTIYLTVIEGFSFVNAFSWVCTTITTLGYPDESFKDTRGRIFAVFWMLSNVFDPIFPIHY